MAESITDATKTFAKVSHAAQYAKIRPSPPPELINGILKFLQEKIPAPFQQAVDVGCGSGQSTGILSPYFQKVLGTDVSEAQISEAKKIERNKNVEYKVEKCDNIPLPDSSVDLITVCTAAHWFDLPPFYKEVERVLKPGGVVALFCYDIIKSFGESFSEEANQHIRQIYKSELSGYWHENAKIADDMYASIELPFNDVVRDMSFHKDAVWTLADLVELVKTWSGYQSFLDDKPEEAKKMLATFENKMLKTMKFSGPSTEAVLKVRWDFVLLMGRKSS